MLDAKVFSKLDANSADQISQGVGSTNYIHHTFWSLLLYVITLQHIIPPEVFQRRMSEILNGIEGAVCVMDDVLVFGIKKSTLDGWRWY